MTAAPTGTPAPPLLRLRDVTKTFGAVVALRSGSIDLHAGSIHALIGENGAGKSTLVKIIAGLHRRDTGDVLLDGQSVDFTSTAQSKAAGIAVIYQEPTLFPDLSVVENIFMGRQPTGALGRIDRKAMREEAERIFDRLGVNIDPDRITDGLSIADQQLIEIAKAISLDARVLIMDEPTAALSGVEVDRLFQVARSLRDEGRALMFISHRFDEIFDLCDTVTVMRDGAYVATTPIADTSVEELVRQMVGRDVDELFGARVDIEEEGAHRLLPSRGDLARGEVGARGLVVVGLVHAHEEPVAQVEERVVPAAGGGDLRQHLGPDGAVPGEVLVQQLGADADGEAHALRRAVRCAHR